MGITSPAPNARGRGPGLSLATSSHPGLRACGGSGSGVLQEGRALKMKIDHDKSTALVTGAASGIGRALACALADRGARVLCADRNLEGASETASTIGRGALGIECDLAEPDGAAALLDRASEIGGDLDIVCSNAGVGYRGRLAESKFERDEALARLFEVNFFAGLKLAQAYAHRLEASGRRGRMLFTASENSLSVPHAIRGGNLGFYGASKHALLIALEWMRIEQRKGPLDLHVLLPGAVYTPLIAPGLPDPAEAPPELELIMPEQCAEIALRGIDLGLFYIPTQAHILEDMQPRTEGVADALEKLGITARA